MSDYEQAYDGEWFHMPLRNWHQMCCDCHKVHKWQFKIEWRGSRPRLYARLWSLGPATGGARSKMGVVKLDDE